MIELEGAHEKPSPDGLRRICSDLSLGPDEILVVGDNRSKDGGAAQAAGCIWAWAEYGTYISLEYRERLETISAPSSTRRHLAEIGPPGAQPEPHFVLSNFSQVPGIVEALNSGSVVASRSVG